MTQKEVIKKVLKTGIIRYYIGEIMKLIIIIIKSLLGLIYFTITVTLGRIQCGLDLLNSFGFRYPIFFYHWHSEAYNNLNILINLSIMEYNDQ